MLLKGTSFAILNDFLYCQRNQVRVIFLEVADRVGCNEKTVRRNVERMRSCGLIEVRKAKGPGTRVSVLLLPAGKSILEQWRQ